MDTTGKAFTVILISLGLLFISCHHDTGMTDEYRAGIIKLRRQHISYLKSDTGWLNLAGLYWLDEGENTFGSDSSNRVIFPPQAPPFMGTFILDSGSVRVRIHPGINVTTEGKPVREMLLTPDTQKGTTILQHGDMIWFVIRRSELTGIRLRDLKNPSVKTFDTIPAWPVDPEWRIKARFVPFAGPMTVQIPNVLGTTYKSTSPGLLYFKYKGKQYTLQPTGDPDNLFIVFADKTSGQESYGSGRFLQVDGPDKEGKYYLDFNKAYNPPCAFTPFATCPVPMKENILPFKVTAGEKVDPAWHGHE